MFLERDPGVAEPAILPMNRAEALIRAARQLILFNPADRTVEQATLLARLGTMVGGVPMLRLVYPARFDALSAVAPLLAEIAAR